MTSCPKPECAHRLTEGNEANEEGTVRVRRTSRAYPKMRSSRRKETLIFCKRWVFEPPCAGCYDEKGILRPALRSLPLLLFHFARTAVLCAAVALFPATAHAQEAIEAWVQLYNGPGNGVDYVSALAVSTNGNVYVTGSSYGGDPGFGGPYDGNDYATIAYSSAGFPLWTNRFNGPQNGADVANALAVGGDGNVVVTGSSVDATWYPHCLTIKYSSAGALLWSHAYAASQGEGRKVAVDADGNVFVLGDLRVGDEQNFLTLKYSSTGTFLWARTYNGPGKYDSAKALVVDANGDVVVTGTSGGVVLGDDDYATLKYSSGGTLLWTRRYGGPGGLQQLGTAQDRANALAVDREGNVIVTGGSASSLGNCDWAYATIKYSSTGEPLWTNRYHGPATDDEATAVAVDGSGSVYVTGSSSGTYTDYATVKYSSSGVPLWTNRYNGPGNYMDRPVAIALDPNGNVFVTGSSTDVNASPDAGYADIVTVAYSSVGAPLWTKRFDGPGNKDDSPGALAVDANGSVCVGGVSEASTSGGVGPNLDQDYVVIKYVTPPIITRQPLSCTNAVGITASFTVEAVGGTPLSYYWRRDGTNLADGGSLSGVTTPNLSIANVQLEDACDYTVVVANQWGSATSTIAHLTVVAPPSAGRFTNLSCSPATGFSFIFRDATVGQHYRIQRSPSSAKGTWVDWLNFTYTEPMTLIDGGATVTSRRFYRAISP